MGDGKVAGAVQGAAQLTEGLPGIDALPLEWERQFAPLFQLISGLDDFAVTPLSSQLEDALLGLQVGDGLEASAGFRGCGYGGVVALNLSPD